MIRKTIITLLLSFFPYSAILAESHPAVISKQQFDQWFDETSNWGRWGEDDELGTLNIITPEMKIRAANLVRAGVSISLSLDLNTKEDEYNPEPFTIESRLVSTGGNLAVVSDKYAVEYHGGAHTHIDSLAHLVHKGKMYNGLSENLLGPHGSEKLGIHNMKDGIFTRGVLVDMAWLRGVDYLENGEAITASDLEEWEVKTGISIRAGDVLLVRTGRWERVRKLGPAHLQDGSAGLHASVALWLKKRDVVAVGSDGGNDVLPSGVEGELIPFHTLALASLGMPLLDNLNLDALSSEALQQKRWEFLFVAAPLRVGGGSGAPLNPLAVF
jgi:kynurenine formamidase